MAQVPAQVPDKVLSWLYSVLHEYHDSQRTYSDAARTLSAYPSLSPRTDVYTSENGASALLLILHGTLPVLFRGTTYRFPIKLWVPRAYPHEAPIVFVDPGKDMVVRPGQHVGVDGRVYHPYLRDWIHMWDRASIAEFLEFLQQVFSKEPPVISRAQQQQYQRTVGPSPQQQQQPGASPGPPRPPPKQTPGAEQPGDRGPPPLPPKPGEEYAEPRRVVNRDGPPLPPLPPDAGQSQRQHTLSPPANGNAPAPRSSSLAHAALDQGYHSGRPPGPPLPPIPNQQTHQPQYQPRTNHDRSPVSPISPVNGYSELPDSRYSRPAPLPPPQFQQTMRPVSQVGPYPPQPQQYASGPPQMQPQPYQPTQYPPQPGMPQQQFQAQKQPPPDLLSDPFEVALPPSAGSNLPAPPIPPNPEREHLLQAINGTLVQQAQQKVNQNLSAIQPLQAQQQALRAAYERLDGEIRQLEQLDQALSSNEAILHRSIQDCDRTIATAKSKKQPPIDEVLIAPTMVSNQLWTLCAEEAAAREAMYVLQKAVDRGRVSGNDFVRQMRGLGRECFLKMALARKCARGMGLETAR
ncbi:hypothetical protein PRZ48_002320 [Zasmidium cellare]|uniref:Uncharacterized protein n=1 Tax=Zasmidium cellare TaxID=395010 RepID=A0ABR0F5T2_ZASCE|nr:hypothetical protein PRZ48_002320 [Zasmidium cellare]